MSRESTRFGQEEKSDDEDSSEEQAFPSHTKRTLQARRAQQPADALTRSAHLAQRPEETLVCTGGAQRAGPSCRKLPRSRALIHQVGREPRPGTRRQRRHRPRTLLLCDQLFSGRENELGGRPFNSGVDVSGPSIFSYWRWGGLVLLAGLSSLSTRIPMNIANEANLLICTKNLKDLARKRPKDKVTAMLSRKKRGGGYSWTPPRHMPFPSPDATLVPPVQEYLHSAARVRNNGLSVQSRATAEVRSRQIWSSCSQHGGAVEKVVICKRRSNRVTEHLSET